MLSGVILAGGYHRRMKGKNRAFLLLAGKTLLERQISEMRTCCNEITIVANDPKPFLKTVDRDIRIITDYFTDKGVLSGMHAGLALAQNQNVWVVGCHMPFPSADAAKLLLAYKKDHVNAVIPKIDGSAFPLHGIYDRSCAGQIVEQLNAGDTCISSFLNRLQTIELNETAFLKKGVGCHFTKTIHLPEDYYNLTRYSTPYLTSPEREDHPIMEQNKAGRAETGSAVSTELSVLIDRLQDEHRELKKKISDMAVRAHLVKAEQDLGLARQELFQLSACTLSFRQELERHSAWEEKILFPFLNRYFNRSSKPSLLRSLWTLEKEHELGDEYLQSFLRSVDVMKTLYGRKRMHAAADELIQACYILSKHLENEEQMVFPLTESVLIDMDLLFST